MKTWNSWLAATGLAIIGVCALLSQPEKLRQVGPQDDGSVLLPTAWSIRPAGTQIDTDTFPMASVLTPDRKYMAVLHGGYNPPSVVMMDATTLKVLSRVELEDAWLGLALSPDGRNLYVGGASRAVVHQIAIGPGGQLSRTASWKLTEAAPTHEDFTGDVAISPDGRLIYAAMLHRNLIAVINPQSGRVIERFETGRRPYRILIHPDNQSFFVSAMGDSAVLHHKTLDGKLLQRVRVGAAPMDMVWRGAKTLLEEDEEDKQPAPWVARIFVAASNTNAVSVIGVAESKDLNVVETINVSMTPVQALGATPSALALSPDESRLYVVCSDLNAVASVDVSRKRSRVEGFVPSGWYPIAARGMGPERLLIFNGRGGRSYPNHVNGPNPLKRPAPLHLGGAPVAYVGLLQRGTISVVDGLDPARMNAYTASVLRNSPYRDEQRESNPVASEVVPAEVGVRSTRIEHVIYIVKENRTYDQMLGDLGKGNGDPSLVLFGEDVTPNHRKLASEFVLLDNFYVNADVSADGHNWSTAAIAPAYVQRMWPNSYAGRRKHYDYEGGEVAANAPAGRIWNNALAAGLKVRNYGWWAENRKEPDPAGQHIARVKDPQLAPHTALKYRAYDLEYRDVDRIAAFLAELKEFEAKGEFPNFITVRLGNDHTSGLVAGKLSPKAYVADNDWALGQLVEALSKSKFWAKTAIFVLEDDAQNGADHVDSHRSPGFLISPYTRRAAIDSTLYNTTSMLRTIELLLGLRPMTVYDASSTPMTRVFANTPRTDPYVAVKPKQPLDERNSTTGPLAARSALMDWDEADEIDDNELNQILWLALKGGTPPAPVRSLFGGR
ncbi:MAG: bifunctional YncE family protein/alkaline phosphatase family protein [Acidobacteriota bacterium]